MVSIQFEYICTLQKSHLASFESDKDWLSWAQWCKVGYRIAEDVLIDRWSFLIHSRNIQQSFCIFLVYFRFSFCLDFLYIITITKCFLYHYKGSDVTILCAFKLQCAPTHCSKQVLSFSPNRWAEICLESPYFVENCNHPQRSAVYRGLISSSVSSSVPSTALASYLHTGFCLTHISPDSAHPQNNSRQQKPHGTADLLAFTPFYLIPRQWWKGWPCWINHTSVFFISSVTYIYDLKIWFTGSLMQLRLTLPYKLLQQFYRT